MVVNKAEGESPNPGSDSFSNLSDACISKSVLEALEEHLRKGSSVVCSQMQGGVRSIWKVHRLRSRVG
jgi:hypothetical protein